MIDKRIARLLTYCVLCAMVANAPATVRADGSTTTKFKRTGSTTSKSDTYNLGDRNSDAAYFGNWGYAPGGYYWNPNDLWHRSRGFWDTTAPACPFRSC